MAAGCGRNIKIYDLNDYDGDGYAYITLKGHINSVICLLFSKRCNWLISGGRYNNSIIRLWK